MIAIFGANSTLAKELIQVLVINFKILAISRSGQGLKHKNLYNIKSNSLDDLSTLIEKNKDKISIWINCAAVRHNALLVEETRETMQKSLDVNFYPNFIATKILIPKMINKRQGHFIFFDSVKAALGDVGCSSYTIGKETLKGLQRSVVKEFSRFNIRCNTIGLLYFESPMWLSLTEDKRKKLLNEVPGKQLISNIDIVSSVVFLIGTKALNGIRLNLDYGYANGSY